jgi:hypothetical protein
MSNLIDQLIGQTPLKSLFKILNKARNMHAKSDKCTDFETLWDIFVDMASAFPTRIMIVVDALDECQTDRSALMDQILSSNEETGGNVRFFLTSRRERDIYDKFTSHSNIIPCVMSVDLLNAPPADLNEMYERILLRLDLAYPKNRQMRKKILSWIAVAKRPLSVKELAYACAVKDDEDSFDPTKRVLATDRYLLDNCGPLIEILNDKVQYTHLSVKEFLLRKQDGFYLKHNEQYLFSEGEVHASVGITCSK